MGVASLHELHFTTCWSFFPEMSIIACKEYVVKRKCMNSISYLADPAGDHGDTSSLLIRRGQLIWPNHGTLTGMRMFLLNILDVQCTNCTFKDKDVPDN